MTRFVGTPLRGIEFSSPSDEAISARVVSDAHARLRIDAGGRLTWSGGSAAGDVNLYRYDINVLKTDDLFQADGGITTISTNGVPTQNLPDGTIAVDTTNDVFYFRSGGEWRQVSSGANVVISATEPVGAESGDLWFDSDTLVLYILNGSTWVSVSGSLTLAELDDVTITSPEIGQVIKYDGTQWVNDLDNSTYNAHTELIGDGALKDIPVTHNFGTRDIVVQCRNAVAPYESIEVGWEATSENQVLLRFSNAPALNSIRANIYAGIGAQGTNAYSETIGDGGATSFVLQHNFNTRDVVVVARNTSAPYETVEINWQATTVDSITAIFSVPPATAGVRVTVYAGGGVAGVTSIVGTANEIQVSQPNGTVQIGLPDDVALTGTPTAPTATPGTDTTQIATTAFVQNAVGSFASTLDGLSDVSVPFPQNGEVLQFDGTEWVSTVFPSNEPTGHENVIDSEISFDPVTRDFTIAPTDSKFTIWVGGRRYEKNTSESINIPNITGLHYVYYGAGGTLAVKNTFFDFATEAPTAYVYWNATLQQLVYFADERHGVTLDWQTHEYLHRTRGAAIASGFGIGYAMPPGQNGAAAYEDALQISIANGTFFDEDIQVDIVDSATPTANTWQQQLSPSAQIPMFYMTGGTYTTGEWTFDSPNGTIVKPSSGVAVFNHFNEGGWINSQLGNSKFGVTWIVATNNLNYPVIGIIGQFQHDVIGEAHETTWDDLILATFPSVEFRPLYKVIFQVSLTGTNSAKASIIEAQDIRRIGSTGSTVPALPVYDHGSMVGLADDDHPQYLNETRHAELDHSAAMSTVVFDDISDIDLTNKLFTGATGTLLYYNGTNWAATGNGTQGLYASQNSLSASEPFGGGLRFSSLENSGVTVSMLGTSSGTFSSTQSAGSLAFTESGSPVASYEPTRILYEDGANYLWIAKPATLTGTNTITLPDATGTIALLGGIALGTDTTGNYVASVESSDLSISVTHVAGEGSTASIALAPEITVNNVRIESQMTGLTVGLHFVGAATAKLGILKWDSTNNQTLEIPSVLSASYVALTSNSLGIVELGTDTNGNYVSDITAGTGVLVTHTPSEGSSPTVSIGQAVGTIDSPTFAGVTGGKVNIGVTGDATIDTVDGNLIIDSQSGVTEINDNVDISGAVEISGVLTLLDKVTAPEGYALTIETVSLYGTGNLSGSQLNLNAGIAQTSTIGATTSGGSINIKAGNASGGANNYGGNVSIDAGIGSTESGSVTIGGMYAKQVNIGNPSRDTNVLGNLIVGGNITVNGTTTTLNTETLAVEDNQITLNSNVTGVPITSAGIEVERGDEANVYIEWNEFSDKWILSNDGINGYEILTSNAVLDELSDVKIVDPQAGEYLRYDAGEWKNVALSLTLNDLSDVSSSSPADGQFLKYVSAANEWQPADVPTINTLDDVGDVLLSLPLGSYDIIQWNGMNWYNSQFLTINSMFDRGGLNLSVPTNINDAGISLYPWVMIPSNYAGPGVTTQLVGSASGQLTVTGQYIYFHPNIAASSTLPLGLASIGLAQGSNYITDTWFPSGTVSTYSTRTGGINTTHVGAMSLGLTYRDSATNTLTNSNFYISFTDSFDALNGNVTIHVPSELTIDNQNGDLLITGAATVSGQLAVSDTIVLNSSVVATPSADAIIEVQRGTSANVAIRWNESTDKWQFTNDGITYQDLGSGGGIIVSATEPLNPVQGTMWFESTTGATFIYYDSYWVEIGGASTGSNSGSDNWVQASSAYSATTGDAIIANTTSASFDVTLPAAPSIGNRVTIVDAYSMFGSKPLTLIRNGEKINSLEQNLVLDIADAFVVLIFIGGSVGWKVV